MKLIFAFAILSTVLNCTTAWRYQHFGQRHFRFRHRIKTFSESEDLWFTQYVDHFNPADTRTWQQRYFVNDEHHKPNGPIFLYFGGEGTADDSTFSLYGGQMFDEAKRFGAKMFLLEHRFYGSSQPMPDLSVESLAYLNTEQALLDAAHFIEGINKAHDLPKNTKWIVFGCSYPGSLAAWMRAKYPHLVHGAVSVSAPLLAKVHFSEFIEHIEKSLKTHSQDCVDVISSATKEMDRMLHRRNGRKKLKKLFKLCDAINKKTSANDIFNLHGTITGIFGEAVQSNENALTINSVCDILVDDEKTPIERLAEVIGVMLEEYDEACLNYKYDDLIEMYTSVNFTEDNRPENDERQWKYQSCTEFGWFQTSTGTQTAFGDPFPIDFIIQQCADAFGPEFLQLVHSGVKRTNIIFGGLDLEKVVSNAVFVHGSFDPWQLIGITKSNNTKAPSIVVEGSSHCADLDTPDDNENYSPEVMQARHRISRLIQQWLED